MSLLHRTQGAARLVAAPTLLVLVGATAPSAAYASAPAQSSDILSPPKAQEPKGRLAGPGTNLGDAILATDGKPAAAGRIPDNADEAAAALWNDLVASSKSGQPTDDGAPRSFTIEFDGRIRRETGRNEFRARFSYLDEGPGLVRGIMLDNQNRVKSTMTRGLGKGDAREYWLNKEIGASKTDGWLRLIGRDYQSDQEEADGWAAISYDIAKLTDPRTFRIVALKKRAVSNKAMLEAGILALDGDPGVRLPDTNLDGVETLRDTGDGYMRVAKLAENLVWLELVTPDFKEFGDSTIASRKARRERTRAGLGPELKRLVFGLDPKTGRPQLVVVAPYRGPVTDKTAAMSLQIPGSLLVQCTDWIECGAEGKKASIPGRFIAYPTIAASNEEREATGRAFRFSNQSNADLFILETSTMNAGLTRAAFVPPPGERTK